MRAAQVICRTVQFGACLLLLAGCAAALPADDPPLPQPGAVPPASAPLPAPASQASSNEPAPAAKQPAALQTSSGAPVTTSPDASGVTDTATAFENVEWVNGNLDGKLTILRVGSSRTEADLLSVFVGLKNNTARPFNVEVQTIYKDRSGQALNEGTGNWVLMKLKLHGEVMYRSVAISQDATDFLVRIRRPQAPPAAAP